ncbi:MAG: hypothetical protein ABIP03_14340 [Aquihabitans sp.]
MADSATQPADFAALGDRLTRFTDHYSQTATPFDWRFNTADLAATLERVGHHPKAALAA